MAGDGKVPTIKLPEKSDGVFYVYRKEADYLPPNDKAAAYTAMFVPLRSDEPASRVYTSTREPYVPKASVESLSKLDAGISKCEGIIKSYKTELASWNSKGGRGGLLESAISETETKSQGLAQQRQAILDKAMKAPGVELRQFAASKEKYELGSTIARGKVPNVPNFSIPAVTEQAKKALKPQTY